MRTLLHLFFRIRREHYNLRTRKIHQQIQPWFEQRCKDISPFNQVKILAYRLAFHLTRVC